MSKSLTISPKIIPDYTLSESGDKSSTRPLVITSEI